MSKGLLGQLMSTARTTNNRFAVIYVNPEVNIQDRLAIAKEIKDNLEYAKKFRKSEWGNDSLEAITEYIQEQEFTSNDCFIVPRECISYLSVKKRYPNVAKAIADNYQPSKIISNNGVEIYEGMEVVVSYHSKYGGTKQRRVRKITDSGIYFDGLHVPVPIHDTHRIFVL